MLYCDLLRFPHFTPHFWPHPVHTKLGSTCDDERVSHDGSTCRQKNLQQSADRWMTRVQEPALASIRPPRSHPVHVTAMSFSCYFAGGSIEMKCLESASNGGDFMMDPRGEAAFGNEWHATHNKWPCAAFEMNNPMQAPLPDSSRGVS